MSARPHKQLNSVLVKPSGPDCNMACRYCFYLGKEALFPQTRVHRMSDEVLEEMVRQVMRQGGPAVSFGWQGGEPTLMGLRFFERAVSLQEKYGAPGQSVANGLQTNGLLLDDDWCRFLRKAPFLVGLSIDGPQEVHNHYRVLQGGQPTWQRVVDGLRRLLDHGVAVNALTVVNDCTSQHARRIYQSHKEQGMRHMQFIPCVEPHPTDRHAVAPFSVAAARYGAFLCELFDCWLEDFVDGKPATYIRWFESVFFTYVDQVPPECTLLKQCGNYLVIEHNGDVFSCDFFVGDQWRLGNVLTGNLSDMLNSPTQTRFGLLKSELPRQCVECEWLSHCRGGCTKERLYNPTHRVSYFCEAYKMFFSHADSRYRRIAADWRRAHDRPQALSFEPPGSRRNAPCPCGSGRKYKHCCEGCRPWAHT